MLIKKVNKISNIGVFSNYENNDLEFKKINLIYGNNSSGKSTLSDIFKDFSELSINRLTSRETIPKKNKTLIKLSYIDEQENLSEKEAVFVNNNWNNININNKILVFDTEFVQNNVFSGLNLLGDKDIESNFSGFILGDTGVKLAKKRRDIDEKLAKERKHLKEKIPNSQISLKPNDKQIMDYVSQNIEESYEDLIFLNNKLKKELENEKNLKKNSDKVNKINYISKIDKDELRKLQNIVESSKNIFSKTYKIKSNNWQKLKEHIDNHFRKNKENGKYWIESGLKINENLDDCPFCGQEIKNTSLIDLYKEYFNEEFNDYLSNIRNEINSILEKLKKLNLRIDITKIVREYNLSYEILGEFISELNSEFNRKISYIEKINLGNERINNKLEELYSAIEIKLIAPMQIQDFDFKFIENYILKCLEIIDDFNSIISRINNKIQKAKAKINKNDNIIKNIEKKVKKNNEKIIRVQEDEVCNEWLTQKEKVKNTLKNREDIDKELEKYQDNYINRYFDDINYFFKQFGGGKYKLKKGKLNKRKKPPVITVRVLFNNIDVTELETSKIFSESDRRALALSIFMSKLKNMDQTKLKHMILVFDDPVTSFDVDRLSSINDSIIDLKNKVSQIFILSHQYSFCRKLYIVHGQKDNSFEFYNIRNKLNDTNKIEKLNAKKFFEHEFFKEYNKLQDFVNGKIEFLSSNDVRTFIEDFLKVSFPKPYCEIYSKKYTPLSKMIDDLRDKDYISEEIHTKLTKFKDNLNPPSHESNFTSKGELRTYTENILMYLDREFRFND